MVISDRTRVGRTKKGGDIANSCKRILIVLEMGRERSVSLANKGMFTNPCCFSVLSIAKAELFLKRRD